MLYLILLLNALVYILLVVYHCKHYYYPLIQRICIRIFFILPLFSLLSFIRFYNTGLIEVCNLIQHCYESFVLFYYFRFIVYCLGNERNYYHLRCIKERGEIKDEHDLSSQSNLLILNDSIVLLSDFIIHEFLSIKFGIFQYCLFMPISSLIIVSIQFSFPASIFFSIVVFLLVLGQNISISYCLYNIIYFLKLVNFVHRNYARLFLVLKGLVAILFWQSLVVDYCIPNAILETLCHLINFIFPINKCSSTVLLSVLELGEFTILGVLFYFTFHPKKLTEMVLIHFKEITTDPEHREYVRTMFPWLKTRFTLNAAVKDALGCADVLLDIKNINKVYKTDVYTEAEHRIHISKMKKVSRRISRLSESKEIEKQPIVHYEDDLEYVKEEEINGGLSNLSSKMRRSVDSSPSINSIHSFEEDDLLYQHAKRIGGYGIRVIEDGVVQL